MSHWSNKYKSICWCDVIKFRLNFLCVCECVYLSIAYGNVGKRHWLDSINCMPTGFLITILFAKPISFSTFTSLKLPLPFLYEGIFNSGIFCSPTKHSVWKIYYHIVICNFFVSFFGPVFILLPTLFSYKTLNLNCTPKEQLTNHTVSTIFSGVFSASLKKLLQSHLINVEHCLLTIILLRTLVQCTHMVAFKRN